MTKIYCDQYCGTAIHFVDGRPHNDRDGKPHICYITMRVREFEGYFNMIQIKRVREKLLAIEQLTINLSAEIAGLSRTSGLAGRTEQTTSRSIRRAQAART